MNKGIEGVGGRKIDLKGETDAINFLIGIAKKIKAGTIDVSDIEAIKENRIAKYMPEFFSTHPLSNNRIEEIHRLAHTNNWPIEGETTPLPVLLRKQ